MRIGLFTDSYRPAVNGITYVVDITRKQLEALGHEVFIFCPAEGVRLGRGEIDDHIIRFRSIRDVFFDDYAVALFFPAAELRKIKKLKLDVIMFFTPGQVGLMGVYAAQKTGAILVGQHSTDLANYIKHYPGVVPGLLILALSFPATMRFKGKDIRELVKIYRPRRLVSKWGQDIIESLMAIIYSRCDAVISLSPKSKKQLESWRTEYDYDVDLIPTGVDALARPTQAQIDRFKATYDIKKSDQVIMYVGRLSAEKNLEVLISMMRRLVRSHPRAHLVFVGDFEYREKLEALAFKSPARERITFTGTLPRDYLGVVYAAADIFTFPSLTDTQGLVLAEAAHAGLPFVLMDGGVSMVVENGENGYISNASISDFTKKVALLLDDEKLRRRFGRHSQKLAERFTEYEQTKQLADLFQREIDERQLLLAGQKKSFFKRFVGKE